MTVEPLAGWLRNCRTQEETLEKKRMGLDQIIEFFVATDLDGQRPSGKTPDESSVPARTAVLPRWDSVVMRA